MNYALARRQAQRVKTLLEEAEREWLAIEDEGRPMTVGTLLPPLIKKVEKYHGDLDVRRQRSKAMKKRRKEGE